MGLNTFLASNFFQEVSIAQERKKNGDFEERKTTAEKVSMINILDSHVTEKRFFTFGMKETGAAAQEDDEIITLEMTVKPRSFEGKSCQLLVARNVTHVLQHEKLQSEYEYI